MSVPNDQMLSTDSIVATLERLPGELFVSDKVIAEAERRITEMTESLKIAEVNASLNAECDGKDAATRDLQRKQAIASNSEVKAMHTEIASIAAEIEIEQANNKMLSRQFAGMCHIAELRAAQMILQAKGVTK